jgi:predicted RND superfamily exporter protein
VNNSRTPPQPALSSAGGSAFEAVRSTRVSVDVLPSAGVPWRAAACPGVLMKESFYARYHMIVLMVAAFLLPVVLVGAKRASDSNTNDVRTWLPDDYDETTQYKWFKDHFGTEEFVLISWEGCALGDPTLEKLANRLVPPADDPAASERRALFQAVLTGSRIVDQLTSPPVNLSREAAIARFQGTLIGPDGRQTCAVVTPTEGGKEHLHTMLDEVYRIAEQECGLQRDALKLGGPPVVNAAVDTEGARSLSRLAGMSGIVGLLIAWWCFRSIKLTVLVFVTALYSGATGLAIVWYCGSNMNAILLTMPPLVYVAAMSGAIHLANYYREALADVGPGRATSSAVAHARLPLSLATFTTAVGLLSLCYSELLPIQQFGVYSALGVVASTLLLFFFLPSALQMWPLKKESAALDPQAEHHDDGLLTLSRGWRWFAETVIRHNGWVALACISVFALCLGGLPQMRTSIKIEKFFSEQTELLQEYIWLEDRLGALVPMELVLRIDDQQCGLNMLERMELVQRVQQQIETLPIVGGTLSAATLAQELPGDHWLRRSTVNKALVRHRDDFVQAHYLSREGTADLWRISLRVEANNDVDYGVFVQDIRERVEPVLAAQRERGVDGLSAVYTGMVPIVFKAQRSLLDGLLFGFGTDLLLIVVAIVVTLRHWSAGLLITVTSVFPAVIIFGIMSWLGIVVDIGTVMAPSVALGVSVDDVVHFQLWYRRGIGRGMDRRQAVMLAYQGCAKPMYQSWGVIGLGLSVFALSPFTPTLRFGALMIALLSAGLVNNLLLLPAMLSGPLGEIFARHIRTAQQRQAEPRARSAAAVLELPVAPEPVGRPVRRRVSL